MSEVEATIDALLSEEQVFDPPDGSGAGRSARTRASTSDRYGDSDLSGQTFSIDERGLTQAHIDAVYPATGSLEGSDIGETYDAWMSTDSSTSFERVC